MSVDALSPARSTTRWASKVRWVTEEPLLFLAIGVVWLWLLLLVVYSLAHVLAASIFPGGQLSLGEFRRLSPFRTTAGSWRTP